MLCRTTFPNFFMDTTAKPPETVEPQAKDFTPPNEITEQTAYKFSVDVWQDRQSPSFIASAVIPEKTRALLPELILNNARVSEPEIERKDAGTRLSEIINTNRLRHDERGGITLDQRTALDIQRFIRNELRAGTTPEALTAALKTLPGPWQVRLEKDAKGQNHFKIAKGEQRDLAFVRAGDVIKGDTTPETLMQTGARLAERLDVLRENQAMLKAYIQGVADFIKRLPAGDARNEFIKGFNERLQANPQTKKFELQTQKDTTGNDTALVLSDKSVSGLLGDQIKIEKPLVTAAQESEAALRRLFAAHQAVIARERPADIDNFTAQLMDKIKTHDGKVPLTVVPDLITFTKGLRGQDIATLSKAFNLALQAEARLNPNLELKDLALRFNTALKEFGRYSVQSVRLQDGQTAIVLKTGEKIISGLPQNVLDASRQTQLISREFSSLTEALRSIGTDPKNPKSLTEPFAQLAKYVDLNKFPQLASVLKEALTLTLQTAMRINSNADPKELVAALNKSLEAQGLKDLKVDIKNGKVELIYIKDKHEKVIAQIDLRDFVSPEKRFAQTIKDAKSDAHRIIALQDAIRAIRSTEEGRNQKPEELIKLLNQALQGEKVDGISLKFDPVSSQIQLYRKDANQEKLVGKINFTDLAKDPTRETMPEQVARIAAPMSLMTPKEYQEYWNQVVASMAKMPKPFQEEFVKALNAEFAKRSETQALSVLFNQNKDGLRLISTIEGNTADLAAAKFTEAETQILLQSADALLRKVFPRRTLAQLDTPKKRELALQLVTSKDPKAQLAAARELAELKVRDITFVDEGERQRILTISVSSIGKSGFYVHVFGNDDKGISRIVLRGISRPDGTFRQEIGKNGKPVDFYGDIWKIHIGTKSYLTGGQDALLAGVEGQKYPKESLLNSNLPLINPIKPINPIEVSEKREPGIVRPVVPAAPFDVDRVVKGLVDAGVGDRDGLGMYKGSFETVKRLLQEYTKDQLDLVKQAFKQKHNIDLEKALEETFSGPQLVELKQLLKGNYDSVTVVMTALADLDQTFFGKSRYQLMKVLRDTFAHKTREEILQMDAQFKERNGGKSMFDVLRDQVKNDPINKDFLETYFRGIDKRETKDIVRLAELAVAAQDIELFKEVFRHSSPEARQAFKTKNPDALTLLNFGSIDNLFAAIDVVEKGEVSVATEVISHRGIFDSTQRGVDAAIDKMTQEQRKAYFAGKVFERKSPDEIAKLTGIDKENWLYYKSIRESMKAAVLTYTEWKLARWEDRIKYGKDGSLITKLLEHEGHFVNSSVDTIISTTFDNMSEEDFKRARDQVSGKEFRQQVERALRIGEYSEDTIAQIMKAYHAKIGLLKVEPWTIDPKMQFDSSNSRSTLEAIEQKRGYFMPDRAGILEAILKMSKAEQVEFLRKEPPSKFREELLNVINSTWSLTDEQRKTALRILTRLDETKELKPDLLDELVILAAKGVKTVEYVKALNKAFQDPKFFAHFKENATLRQELEAVLFQHIPFDDYHKYAKPYLTTGKLEFKTKATLNDNFFWSHDDVFGILDAVKAGSKEDRADIIKNAHSILPFLTDDQRNLVVKVAKQEGEIKPEDRLRAAILTGKADVVRQTAEAMKAEERLASRQAYESGFGTLLIADLIRVGKFDAQMASRLFERQKTNEQRFIDVQDEFSGRMGGFSEWFVNQYDASGPQAYNRMNELVAALSKAKLLNTDLTEEEQKRLFDGVRNVLENWRQSRNAGAEVVADLIIMAGAILLSLPSGGTSLAALAATSVGRAILKTLLKNGATRLATEAALAAALRPGFKELIMQEDYDFFSKEGAADAVIGALSLLFMKVGPQELAKISGLFTKPANALSQEFGQIGIRTGDLLAEEFIKRSALSAERLIGDLTQKSATVAIRPTGVLSKFVAGEGQKVFEQEIRHILIKSLLDGGKLSTKEIAEKLALNPAFRKLVEEQINARLAQLSKDAVLKGIPLDKFVAKYLSDPRFIRELEAVVESGLKEALKDLSKLSLLGQRQLLQTTTGALTGGFDGLARGVMQWDRSLSPEENIHNILLQTSVATVFGGTFTTVLTAPGNLYKATRLTHQRGPLNTGPLKPVDPHPRNADTPPPEPGTNPNPNPFPASPVLKAIKRNQDISTPDRFEILRHSPEAKHARRLDIIKSNLSPEQTSILSKEQLDILARNFSKVPRNIISKLSPDELVTIADAVNLLSKDVLLHSSEFTLALLKHPKLAKWILEHAPQLKQEQIYSVLRNWEKLSDSQRALPPKELIAEVRKLYPKAETLVPQRKLRVDGNRIINESYPHQVPVSTDFLKTLNIQSETELFAHGFKKVGPAKINPGQFRELPPLDKIVEYRNISTGVTIRLFEGRIVQVINKEGVVTTINWTKNQINWIDLNGQNSIYAINPKNIPHPDTWPKNISAGFDPPIPAGHMRLYRGVKPHPNEFSRGLTKREQVRYNRFIRRVLEGPELNDLERAEAILLNEKKNPYKSYASELDRALRYSNENILFYLDVPVRSVIQMRDPRFPDTIPVSPRLHRNAKVSVFSPSHPLNDGSWWRVLDSKTNEWKLAKDLDIHLDIESGKLSLLSRNSVKTVPEVNIPVIRADKSFQEAFASINENSLIKNGFRKTDQNTFLHENGKISVTLGRDGVPERIMIDGVPYTLVKDQFNSVALIEDGRFHMAMAFKRGANPMEVPKQWNIDSDLIEPPVPSGHTRLYRGISLKEGHEKEFLKSLSLEEQQELNLLIRKFIENESGDLSHIESQRLASLGERKSSGFKFYAEELGTAAHYGGPGGKIIYVDIPNDKLAKIRLNEFLEGKTNLGLVEGTPIPYEFHRLARESVHSPTNPLFLTPEWRFIADNGKTTKPGQFNLKLTPEGLLFILK